jgi:hypothetical protein
MRDSIFWSASAIQKDCADDPSTRWKAVMLDLTYADVDDFHRSHVTSILRSIREWLRRRGYPFRYVWRLELGEAFGRPHYHIVLWLPRGLTLPKPDKRGWWPWGMTRIQWARNPVNYIMKYTGKPPSDLAWKYPENAHICGSGGLSATTRMIHMWRRCPEYVREHWPSPSSRPIRAPGGGWVSRLMGDWIPAAYQYVGTWGGIASIRQVRSLLAVALR